MSALLASLKSIHTTFETSERHGDPPALSLLTFSTISEQLAELNVDHLDSDFLIVGAEQLKERIQQLTEDIDNAALHQPEPVDTTHTTRLISKHAKITQLSLLLLKYLTQQLESEAVTLLTQYRAYCEYGQLNQTSIDKAHDDIKNIVASVRDNREALRRLVDISPESESFRKAMYQANSSVRHALAAIKSETPTNTAPAMNAL